MKRILSVSAFVASASLALAAFTPITSITYNGNGAPQEVRLLTSLTTYNGDTFTASGLGNGTSLAAANNANTPKMDDFDINNLATGHTAPLNTVMFGGILFTNANGALPDFFIFEGAGTGSGNPDDITVAAIFEGPTPAAGDDTVGVAVTAPTGIASPVGWGNTGVTIGPNMPQAGQVVAGLCWDITDLKDASGANLTSATVIKGIQIAGPQGSGIDVLAFLAVTPPILIDHFAVTTSVASTNVGDVFEVTITAQDSGNNTVSSGSAVISVVAAGSLMQFDWNSDGTYGDNSGTLEAGVKTIKARNLRAEITTAIVASVGAITTTTPPSVTTTALAFSKLQVLAPGETAAPGTATGKNGAPPYYLVGTPFTVTVNAVDAYWNYISTAPADIIAILSTDNTATLPAAAPLDAGANNFSVTFNQRGTFTVTATNTSNALITNGVSASIVSALPLVWQGDGSLNGWDILTTANWTNLAGAALTYANGDEVRFDDTGSTTPAVNIVTNVAPSTFTVNSANNYTFGSTNGRGIAGAARLTKTGAGTLTLNTSNSYTGGSSFSDGVVVLSNAFALPTSGTLTMTNSMLVLAATNITRGSGQLQGTSAGFAAVGADRSVNLGGITWGNANCFSDSPSTAVLVLGRATDSFTLDFQSQIDLGNPGQTATIQVDDGAAAVDAVLGRIQDTGASPGVVIKTGAGTVKLAGNSNYDSPTEIQNGTVILPGTGGFSGDNVIVLGNGATSGVLQLGDASGGKNLTVGSLTISGTGTGNRVVGGYTTNSTLTVNTVFGGVTFDGVLGGPGANQNNLALAKNGTGLTLTLTASNTYTGLTIVNSGTLALSDAGSINNSVSIEVTAPDVFDVSAVTGGYVLGAAQTLKGLGSVTGNMTAKGQIRPGSTGIGTLTFNNDLTLTTSTVVMEINNTNSPNSDQIATYGTFTPGGSLVVTNIGSALNLGDTFQLFTLPVVGSFSSIVYPPAPSGTQWTNNLAVDGTIALEAATAPTPTNITFSVSGGKLILDWPAGQGWQLQSQANPLTVGIGTNWVNVPGAVPPFTNAVNPASGAVFYRLVYP